jgi:hypothetical protein
VEPGASFVAGSVARVEWVDTIKHDTMAYRLSFIPSQGADPVAIAENLPATEYGYAWQVPDEPCSDCSLFIVQDNGGVDYTATLPILIIGADAGVDAGGGTAGSASDAGPGSPSLEGANDQGGCTVARGPRTTGARAALSLVWLAIGLVWWRPRRGSRGRAASDAVR